MKDCWHDINKKHSIGRYKNRKKRKYYKTTIVNLNKHLTNPIFKIIAEVAETSKLETYVVGGFVRDILLKRKKNIGRNLSISYQEPLHMLEAKDQFFYDEQGRKYLDCVNNISHVGHSNNFVHNALVKQNLKMNTNTRYLYNIINEYSDRLLKTF